MEENLAQSFSSLQLDSRHQNSEPRPYVYRSAQPDAGQSHPMRRSTDNPGATRGIATQFCPQPLLLKFRVFLKLNN